MLKPASLNSYLGEEGTTVQPTVYHTPAGRGREVAVGSANLFDSEENSTSFKRLPEDKQHATSSSTISTGLKPVICVSRRSATSYCSVGFSFSSIDCGNSCRKG